MHLDEHERQIVLAMADAALPVGERFPGSDRRFLERIEALLSSESTAVGAGYRALLWTLEWSTWATFGARFSRLPLGRRLRALGAESHSELRRLVARGLLLPLKLARFDDPNVANALGCRYSVSPPPALEAARWRSQVHAAADLPDRAVLECDVVVVGTGAGGAPVAAELARRGHAVLIVEEGEYLTRRDFNGRPLDMIRKAYKHSGRIAAVGNTVIPIPVGVAVGGTTLINSGTMFRLPPATFARWQDELGLVELSATTLAPYYDRVERLLEAGPSSPAALGKPAVKIADGCERLGYSHHPLSRNAPGCDGQGLCCFGCPTDAKRSTNVSFIPAALQAGAELYTGFKVERLLTLRERAVGVSGVAQKDGRPVSLSVRARVVVLAAGTLSTPLLLLADRLANTSGQVGRNLTIHPATAAVGLYPDDLDSGRTVPQGYGIDEFRDEGLMFEGAQAPLDLTAVSLTSFGPRFVSQIERYRHTLAFGFMVADTSRGRVRQGPQGEPWITYWLNGRDRAQIQRGHAILARVMLAGGALEVYPGVHGVPSFKDDAEVAVFERRSFNARDFDLTAYHPLGTCRMGHDPFTSVVDSNHETHDVHNLFVCDGSVLCGPLGVNPQLTIMAMSLRAAEKIAHRLERLQAQSAA
ncbi:MAG: GMC family oxidoreductase [Deltaproteobacteria bacterium]|nr:GMC family oxidoreductase [Deltaproteobacteria bacterium]